MTTLMRKEFAVLTGVERFIPLTPEEIAEATARTAAEAEARAAAAQSPPTLSDMQAEIAALQARIDALAAGGDP